MSALHPHGYLATRELHAADPTGHRAFHASCTAWTSARDPGVRLVIVRAIAFESHAPPVVVKEASEPWPDLALPSSCVRSGAVAGAVAGDARGPAFVLTGTVARGCAQAAGRALAWDCALEPRGPGGTVRGRGTHARGGRHGRGLHALVDGLARIAPVPSTDAVTVSGHVVVNGEPWLLGRWGGSVVRREGPRSPAGTSAWVHGAQWSVDGAAHEGLTFEGQSARLGPFRGSSSLAALVSPLVTRARAHRTAVGREGGVSPKATLLRAIVMGAGGRLSYRRWLFEGRGETGPFRAEFWAEAPDFVGVHDEEPDGTVVHTLHAGLARGRLAWDEQGTTMIAHTHAATLVIRAPRADHGIRMYV